MSEKQGQDRLDAWYDGSAICIIAVGSHGDPLDLGDEEVEAYIEKLSECLSESRGAHAVEEQRGRLAEIESALASLGGSAECGVSKQYIEVRDNGRETVIGGNTEGLIHLALQLVRLAQKTSVGAHVHIDGASVADISERDVVLSLSKAPWA